MAQNLQQYAPATLRIGISLVLIWFGTEQLMNASDWVGWLPEYVLSLPVSPVTLVYINGFFETIFGLLLLAGIYTRFTASILALHMAHIISVVGYGEIGVRDFGIFIALLSVAFYGPDQFGLDGYFTQRKEKISQI